jgi:hypothetical protein
VIGKEHSRHAKYAYDGRRTLEEQVADEKFGAEGCEPEEDGAAGAGEPDEQLDVVFTTNDDSEALVVKGLLESNGFQVLMSTPEAPIGVFPISSSDLGQVRLRVRAERAEQARAIIAESKDEGAEAAEEAERDSET